MKAGKYYADIAGQTDEKMERWQDISPPAGSSHGGRISAGKLQVLEFNLSGLIAAAEFLPLVQQVHT
jgi:hypothetical protein